MKFNADGAQHEAVNYTFLGWFFFEWGRVLGELKRFFELFTPEELRHLLEQSWKMRKALLTWPAGKLKDAPSLLSSVHILLAEWIFGKGNWENPLPDPPVANPRNIKQCYASDQYTSAQGLQGFRRIREDVDDIDANGGFGFIDVNTAVVGLLKDLEDNQLADGEADYKNVKSLEEYFRNSLGWMPFFDSQIMPVVVLRKPNLDIGGLILFRLLFLYTPFCFATFWNPQCTKVSLKRLRPMARTVMQCQVSY